MKELLGEGTTLQSRLSQIGKMKNINVLSRKFCEYMRKGKVNSAIKLLSNKIEVSMLPINKETIDLQMLHL